MRVKGVGDLQWNIEFYRGWKGTMGREMLKHIVRHDLFLILNLDKNPQTTGQIMHETCVFINGEFRSACDKDNNSLTEDNLTLPCIIRELIKGISKNKFYDSVAYDWYGERKIEIKIETPKIIRKPDNFLESLVRKINKDLSEKILRIAVNEMRTDEITDHRIPRKGMIELYNKEIPKEKEDEYWGHLSTCIPCGDEYSELCKMLSEPTPQYVLEKIKEKTFDLQLKKIMSDMQTTKRTEKCITLSEMLWLYDKQLFHEDQIEYQLHMTTCVPCRKKYRELCQVLSETANPDELEKIKEKIFGKSNQNVKEG